MKREKNPVMELAEKIGQLTEGLCSVGPGPYGFGTMTAPESKVILCMEMKPALKPEEKAEPELERKADEVFPDTIAEYKMIVCGYGRESNEMPTSEELETMMTEENRETKTVAGALKALQGEEVCVSREECLAAFKEMADKIMEEVYQAKEDEQAEKPSEDAGMIQQI